MEPPIIARLPDGPVRTWARELHALWAELGRTPSADVRQHPERYALYFKATYSTPLAKYYECIISTCSAKASC